MFMFCVCVSGWMCYEHEVGAGWGVSLMRVPLQIILYMVLRSLHSLFRWGLTIKHIPNSTRLIRDNERFTRCLVGGLGGLKVLLYMERVRFFFERSMNIV